MSIRTNDRTAKDWRSLRIADVGEVVTGKTPSTKKPEYWNGNIPFITPGDLNDGIINGALRTISESGLAEIKELPRGSIAVSCIGYIGKAGYIDCRRSATNQQINSVVPSSEHDALFLLYRFISIKDQLEAAGSITTVPILNKSNFENFWISVPMLAEQRAIGSILRTAQHTREICELVIATTRQLKQSLLRYLFTYGPVPFDQADKVPLKETEIGLMPEHWEISHFSESLVRPEYSVGKIQQSDYADFGQVPIIDQGQRPIAGYTDDEEQAYKGPLPLIIFGDHTRVFKYVDYPFVCGADGTKLIHPNVKYFDPHFFYHACCRLDIASRGYNRHYSLLKEKALPKPPIAEQVQIVELLSGVEAKESAEKVRRDALANLFDSLLYHLMAGKVRVSE